MSVDLGLFGYLAAWYGGNMLYSNYNKGAAADSARVANSGAYACDGLKAPKCEGADFAMLIATAQLAVGVVYALFLWIAPDARTPPKITVKDFLKLVPAGVCSAGAHAASVFSLTYGVAFGQVVKAAEPAFAAVISYFIYGHKVSAAKWFCLLPIIGGIVLCCTTPDKVTGMPGFSEPLQMGALIGGVVANICAAFKGAEQSKVLKPDAKHLTNEQFAEAKSTIDRIGGKGNTFALMTIISLLASIPLAIMKEGKHYVQFEKMVKADTNLFTNVVLSGLTFYAYNEAVTMSVEKLSPVTSSVANTAKRVVVILVGVVFLGENFGGFKPLGCAICMIGVFLYAAADSMFPPKAAAADKKEK